MKVILSAKKGLRPKTVRSIIHSLRGADVFVPSEIDAKKHSLILTDEPDYGLVVYQCTVSEMKEPGNQYVDVRKFIEVAKSGNIQKDTTEGIVLTSSERAAMPVVDDLSVLKSKKVDELKTIAKALGLSGYSKMKKSEIIDLITTK